MIFDTQVPSALKKSQLWFASIITRPIDEDSRMNPISPSGNLMEEEAWDFINPSPTLRPAQRIQIYNQQYWWRLLNCLQENFPFVTRLFGYHDFNQTIGIPYLNKYPPRHWSLNNLGDQMLQWIDEEYHAKDKPLIKDAAHLDWAYHCSFTTAAYPTLSTLSDNVDLSSLLIQKLYLQPHVYLFQFNEDLIDFRNEMMKHEPDYWVEHDFPVLKRDTAPYFFVVHRTPQNFLTATSVSQSAYKILQLFKNGAIIDNICSWIENQDETFYFEVSTHLHLWFQEWVGRQWLFLEKNGEQEKLLI